MLPTMTGARKRTWSEGAVVNNSRVETLATSVIQPLPLRKTHHAYTEIYSPIRHSTAYDPFWAWTSKESTFPLNFLSLAEASLKLLKHECFLLGSLFLGRNTSLGPFSDFISPILITWLSSALSCTDTAATDFGGAACTHSRAEHGPAFLGSCKCSWSLNRGHVELLA